MIAEVVLSTTRELERWARVRGGDVAYLARRGVGDAGRVLRVIERMNVTTIEEVLAGDSKRAADGGFSLCDFGEAVRAMANDVEYAVMRQNGGHQ